METVFVIDDDHDTAEVVRTYLEMHKFKVCACPSFEAALQALQPGEPCIVLTDIQVPGQMTVEQFVLNVRQQHPDVKVILFSARNDCAAYAKKVQAHSWLQKPIDPEDVVKLTVEHCETAE